MTPTAARLVSSGLLFPIVLPEPSSRAVIPSAPGGAHWVGRFFADLGSRIESRLPRGEVAGDVFADLATAVLTEFAPPQPIDLKAMVDWISSGDSLPRQVNFHGGFGQPPLTVWAGELFYLEVLFWFPSRTAIHGHGFSGAFRVLSGYSVQSTYAFTETEKWAHGLRVGELRIRNLELLLPGRVCDIRADEAFVHSVIHMGNPSLTLVARTFRETDVLQHTYFRSGVAYAASWRKQELTRRLEVLLALGRNNPGALKEHLPAYLEKEDDFGRFTACLKLSFSAFALDDPSLLDAAARRWPRLVALARACAEESLRSERIYRQLDRLPDSKMQLLAILGEVCGGREEVDRVLAELNPSTSPQAVLAEWATLVPRIEVRPA